VPAQINTSINENFLETLEKKFAGVKWSKSGSQKSQDDMINSMIRGFALAMIGIYALMAIPFKSYLQPIIVMTAIPFGLIGAGVVVNDNLVLVDYINRKRDEGMELTHYINLTYHLCGLNTFNART